MRLPAKGQASRLLWWGEDSRRAFPIVISWRRWASDRGSHTLAPPTARNDDPGRLAGSLAHQSSLLAAVPWQADAFEYC